MVEQDILDYYRSWLEYRRWFLRVPGVQAYVQADGQPQLSVAFGSADLEAGTPLTERHLFRIASHSKSFTAVALLRLVERGRLRLDDRWPSTCRNSPTVAWPRQPSGNCWRTAAE